MAAHAGITAPGAFNKATSCMEVLQHWEITSTGRIRSWVDSTRASSPTRENFTPAIDISPGDVQHGQHPSALDMLGEIAKASRGKQIIMFLDYDGTLSPIVEDAEKAFMSDEMRSTVKRLARDFPTAIVSGRCVEKVCGFVKLKELYYAGSHGMDIKGPHEARTDRRILCQPAREFLPLIEEVHERLLENIASIPGAKVEDNKFCLSVHYRSVEEKKWVKVARAVGSVMIEHPRLRVTRGRKVLEVRPNIKWDKGKAVEFLLRSLGDRFDKCEEDIFPIYIGDDKTDEDAFEVLQQSGRGLGILVSKTPRDTNASYTLEDPMEVMKFLQLLVASSTAA